VTGVQTCALPIWRSVGLCKDETERTEVERKDETERADESELVDRVLARLGIYEE